MSSLNKFSIYHITISQLNMFGIFRGATSFNGARTFKRHDVVESTEARQHSKVIQQQTPGKTLK